MLIAAGWAAWAAFGSARYPALHWLLSGWALVMAFSQFAASRKPPPTADPRPAKAPDDYRTPTLIERLRARKAGR